MPSTMQPTWNEIPPLRAEPTTADHEDKDGNRIDYAERLWNSQDWALQSRDRQIEENCRMIAGQHWHIWSDLLQKWVDVTRFMTDKERRWRQRPVVNHLLYWFMLTHARMTENPPIVTFLPSTGDRADAQLAEVMDTIYKSLWAEMGMEETLDRFFTWLIPGGEAFLYTRVDLNEGPIKKLTGSAVLDVDGEEIVVDDAPYDKDGNALVEMGADGAPSFTGEPHQYREGVLRTEVLAPVQVRGEWGPMPWHEKRWIQVKSMLTPEEVWDRWGVEVPADSFGHTSTSTGELERLLFGAGYFGAAGNDPGTTGYTATQEQGLVTVITTWMKPTRAIEGMESQDGSPGGRLLVITPDKVLFDGPRPANFKSAGPIQHLDFVRVPGRPAGTSPQEMLNPLNRTINRGVAQMLEHRNLVCNPPLVIDDQSGLTSDMITNKPGLAITVTRRPGVPALEFITPPRLSEDVYKSQQMMEDTLGYLGNLEGATGDPPTRDASGELVKELRFNSDRFIGPTMRRAVHMHRRVVEDWMVYLPLIWDREKIIAYAGDDFVTRTVTVLPEMFEEGNVHIRVDIESMLPEGRGERQSKAYRMYSDGLFGEPGSPPAIARFFEVGRFPHMGRKMQPGGIDRVTAEQENGKIVQGLTADQVPVLDWYDNEVHLVAHEEFMKSPEFLKLEPPVMDEFVKHREVHRRVLLIKLQQQMEAEAEQAAAGIGPEGASNGGPPPAKQPSGGTEVPSGGPQNRFPGS